MPLTREVAEACAKDGLLEILQKGERVDPDSYKGPIRLRLVRETDAEKERKERTTLPARKQVNGKNE